MPTRIDPYWDHPDPALNPEVDVFSLFLANEVQVQRMRDLGAAQDVVTSQRDALDQAYVHWRQELVRRWMSMDPSLRGEEDFFRTRLPQLMFWACGGLLGPV